MNTAIIVAAGSGSRFGGQTPKQFLPLLGKPLIIHTLERFQSCPEIDEIVLVLPATEVSSFTASGITKLRRIVKGGATRAESVLNGLNAVSANTDFVAVHDGARPLVTADEISKTVNAANEFGAACLVAPVADTIKEISDTGSIVKTIDRKNLRRALTPQCFRYDILVKAFDGIDLLDLGVTDECYLVERLGVQITVVDGSPKNIKITTVEDFALAENYLKQAAAIGS